MRRKKGQEGITLIALIITVIVMLILAGVAISVLTGDEGLYEKTINAAQAYEDAAQKEADEMQNWIDKIDIYLNGVQNVPDTMKIGVINTEKNQTFDKQTTGTYNNPIIPKGFAPINENGADWGTADGYKKGLVIRDELGNEFVWVPVDGTIVKFERYNWNKGDYGTESVPIEISISVKDNGGFYIARYEAGIANGMAKLTSDSTQNYGNGLYKPVSKKGAIIWNYIQWGTSNNDITPGNGAVTVARNMYPEIDNNYGVVSTLIYGAHWDTALKFIGAYNIGETG